MQTHHGIPHGEGKAALMPLDMPSCKEVNDEGVKSDGLSESTGRRLDSGAAVERD